MCHLQEVRRLINIVNPRDLIYKLKLPFRKDRELHRSLYHILGFYPRNINLYKQALMHKSALGRRFRGEKQNNERLEFLGDAILDAVVGDIVYHHFQGKPEGFLTNTRSKIVQRETLNNIATEMGLQYLIKSGENVRNAHNSNLNGNAFEAIVGAVYEDYGYEYCKRFMERRILKTLLNIDKIAYKEMNFKSKLLEWCQKNRLRSEFELQEEGKEGASSPTFVSCVVIEGVDCGHGKGYTKKESQQIAAKDALQKLKKQRTLHDRVFEAKSKRTAMDEQPEALVPDVPEDLCSIKEERSKRPTRPGSTAAKRQERRRKEIETTSAPAEASQIEAASNPQNKQKENSRQRRQRKVREAKKEVVKEA